MPDVPRPILSRDDARTSCAKERENHARHCEEVRIHALWYKNARNCRENEYSHPSLAHSQDCRIRNEAASEADPTYRDRVERAEQRKMDFYAKEVEQMEHARRASLEPSVVPGPPAVEIEVEDRSSVREAKRAREEPAQDLSGEISIPSADETLTNPEILAVPSGVIQSSSIPAQISPGASSRSGVKRTYSESTALPKLLGITSGSGVKRACNESTAPSNPPVVSSGSRLKRAHENSSANDDEEQPGTRARI